MQQEQEDRAGLCTNKLSTRMCLLSRTVVLSTQLPILNKGI